MKLATNRVESFSDGVIAIIITIMVFKIELPEPIHNTDHFSFAALFSLLPYFLAYVVSFLMLGIIWVNHHHLLFMVQRTDERMLWLNLHLLFWLSLIPFPTTLLGSHPFETAPAALYGIVMFMNIAALGALRHYAMKNRLMFGEKEDNSVRDKVSRLNRRASLKDRAGLVIYLLGIGLAFVTVYASYGCYLIATFIFFIPDGVDDEKVAEQIVEENK